MSKVIGSPFVRAPFKGSGRVEGKRVFWEGEGDFLCVEPYGKNSIRFRSSASLHIDEDLNWTLLPQGGDEAVVEVTDEKAVIKNGKVWAEVWGDGSVNYYNDRNEPLLLESWIDARENTVYVHKSREYRAIASDAFEIDLYFKANPKERFHGMGHHPNDCFELRGCTIPLEQKNTQCTVPFAVSNLGYGFLWNNPAVGRAEFAGNHTLWHANMAKQIDYIVIAGDTPAEIMTRYTGMTGRAPVLPEWAAGFWQCKLRYETQDELLNVAREYKKRGIPLSVIVCDYFHWTMQGEWKFDSRSWPDPQAMVDELATMGIKLMVSVWPTVDTRSENYIEMRNKNYLMRSERGLSILKMFHGAGSFYDATHPDARKFVWDKIKQNYYDYGIKMFWLDESEPSFEPYHYDNIRYYLGNGSQMANIYPYHYAQTFSDGLREQGETEIVNLLRCVWLGSQRNGVVYWTGDVSTTFDTLREQIKAGLNFSFSGVPWWTTDIGGFFFGDPDNEEYREVFVRWFQFGAFSPIFRLHGKRAPYWNIDRLDPGAYNPSAGPNEIWSYGEENYEILKGYIFLRQRLMPYIMEQMKAASETGIPVMRPLLFDFPKDEATADIWDEYLFGPDILVAPIVEAGLRSRPVYLPTKAKWTNAYTGETYEGGRTITADAPLNTIPVFFRDGATDKLANLFAEA